MRAPSSILVLDAAVPVAAALVTTDRVVHEARRRIALGLRRPDFPGILNALIAEITVVPVTALAPYLARSETALSDAVLSRNGSTKDAHVLALAWSVDADVWTTDRDVAGTGVASPPDRRPI